MPEATTSAAPAFRGALQHRRRLQAALVSLGVGTLVFLVKLLGWRLSGSTAVLSDALESIVNMLAAGFAVGAIRFASNPADPEHPYGHGKIEFLSAAFEGGLITFAALPAITEEFVFRSVIITEYEESGCGGGCAALLSALLFAMLHFNISQFPIYLLGGLIFAAVALVTRSVVAAMAVHFLNNIYQLFVESYLFSLIKHPQNMVFLIFTCILLFLICLALTLGQIERIYYIYGVTGRQSPAWVSKRKKSPARTVAGALTSPTLLLCVLFFVTVTFGISENF
jgi:membrane protease YdiL (CAAX protease family)